MGIYDRDYYRPDRGVGGFSVPRTAIGTLILLNVIIYLANALFTSPLRYNDFPANILGGMNSWLALRAENLAQPWYWWRFLTYGFAHSYGPQHIVFNMLGLWFLGREVETLLGRKEFLRFYLAALFVASFAWAIVNRLQDVMSVAPLLGASGAVTAVVVLYAVSFPHRTVLLFFAIPVPAWFIGVLYVAGDLYGSLVGHDDPRSKAEVAYGVHLAGAAFAFLYFYFKWNLGRLLPNGISLEWLKRRPQLRIHDPDETGDQGESKLNDEVDRILEKISREGESSLTRRERRVLETASREYQRRRRSADSE